MFDLFSSILGLIVLFPVFIIISLLIIIGSRGSAIYISKRYGRNGKFFNMYKNGEVLKLNIAHNEGNFFTNQKHLIELEEKELIPIKYCNEKGSIISESNPNGSLNNIAGILNKNKNILGMMPHPERMTDKINSDQKGLPLFLSLMN